MKRALILGAGLVAGPHVRYLLNVEGFSVTVASRTVEKARRLIGNASNGKALSLDVHDERALEELIAAHDLSVSLLPYAFHPTVARLCVKHGTPMVTTSYVKDEMRALDEAAREAGVILLNEIGVDPGIDHMSAMRVIDRIRDEGGRLVSFVSNTGGLPAPEANDNPLGYKFSWAPRGVLLAGKNPARYLRDNKTVEVPGPELFAHHAPCKIAGFGELEVYPNRDSLPYIETYGISGVETMYRGTLRYPGWCDTLKAIVDLGFLNEAPRDDLAGLTYRQLTARRIGSAGRDPAREVAQSLGIPADAKPIADLDWLGFFSDEPLPSGARSLLDVLALRMLPKMQYAPGERDMLVMQHEFVVEREDRRERRTSTLVDYGIPNGDSSMSRLVGLPAAVAVRRILQGELELVGVQVPTHRSVYEPILDEMETMGVAFSERSEIC